MTLKKEGVDHMIMLLYNNNCVQLISNYLTNEASENARRWNNKNTSFEEVERPMTVQV